MKELSGELRSAKAERRKERKEVAVNGDTKYHAVERLVSVSTCLIQHTVSMYVALSPGHSHISGLSRCYAEILKM